MTPISICVIAKNEEKHMENFLSAIKEHMSNYPHEVVIVDTGSTDRTVEIAKKYTDKVFFFEWINDFSAARNYSISKANNDWILVLDCDEYIAEVNPTAFDWMANKHPLAAGMITLRNCYELNGFNSSYTEQLSRFFNRKLYHFESTIHEQLCPIKKDTAYKRVDISLHINHYGYSGTPEELAVKAERNNKLLFEELEKNPTDPYIYFQLGQSYNMIHDDEKSCYYYEKGMDYATDSRLAYVEMMVTGYGYALLRLQRNEDALLLENLYDDFSHSADYICMLGLIYLRNGQILKAMKEFLKATTMENGHVEGVNSFIPTYNMGCINEVLGDINTAIKLYRKCGNFPPSLDRLAELESNTPTT